MTHFNPQSIADSLTPEQYIKLVEVAFGELPEEIQNMSDDELLEALEA